jgi:hypothetical protein
VTLTFGIFLAGIVFGGVLGFSYGVDHERGRS